MKELKKCVINMKNNSNNLLNKKKNLLNKKKLNCRNLKIGKLKKERKFKRKRKFWTELQKH